MSVAQSLKYIRMTIDHVLLNNLKESISIKDVASMRL